MICHQSPTRACVTGNGGVRSLWDNVAVRHEVAIITVEPALQDFTRCSTNGFLPTRAGLVTI